MATAKTLNAKNLSALGPDRLAQLLIDLTQGDAAMKRRLRLELASLTGSGDVAAEIRKRLVSIARSKSFVDWNKVRPLAQDLDTQRSAIMTHVAPTQPREAFDLLWRLLDMAPSIYERCDDSNGAIATIIAQAREDLVQIAPEARLDPARLAERVYDAVCADDYGQFDGLIGLMAKPLGPDGLAMLKAKFEQLAANQPPTPAEEDREIVALSWRGPIFADEFATNNHAHLVQEALAEIADASGDIDSYVMLHSEKERTAPDLAARIAERFVKAGRPAEALAALALAEEAMDAGGHWPDWPRVKIDALEASGMHEDAQRERWAIFERTLKPEYLKAFIKRLPDFDDMEAEEKAMAHARQFPLFHQALSFLIEWPALDEAATTILARRKELNGDHYWLLTPAAEALEHRHPLSATLLLRAMIDFALETARHKRYPHAAGHLQTCAHLAGKISTFGEHPDHETYLASLKARHGRKIGFWNA